jgi:hypothetical protein
LTLAARLAAERGRLAIDNNLIASACRASAAAPTRGPPPGVMPRFARFAQRVMPEQLAFFVGQGVTIGLLPVTILIGMRMLAGFGAQ